MSKRKGQKKDEAENIKVLVRARPLNPKEVEMGMQSAVDLDLAEGTVTVHHVCGAPDRWTFDAVVNNTYSQKDIFIQNIQPLVDSVLGGFNATIFAYGQSGSGKTYTMSGVTGEATLQGIIPRSFSYIFNHIREKRNPNITYSLSCSFLELYNGKIRDLLAKQQVSLQIKENKDKTFYVMDLSTPQVKFEQDLMGHMEEGNIRRQVAATELNTDSSRSHSIFTVAIQMVENFEDGECRTVTSKLNLVDLAGSERQRKTRASGDTLKEGCNINLSLSALGTVIDTIVKGKGHIPFRSSPLTMLLKDSLGGTSKTVMFANINPADANVPETVSTLRFADRAKQIKNKPVMQMDAKDQKIQDLLDKVHELQEKLKNYEGDVGPNYEEENERLQERISVLEAEAGAAREEVMDANKQHNQAMSLKDKELERFRADYEQLEEALQEEQDRVKLTVHTIEERSAEYADLNDVIVGFINEVEEKEAPESIEDIKSALHSIKEYVFNSCSEGTLDEERARLQDEHNKKCMLLKQHIKELEASEQELQTNYREEKETRKSQHAVHTKEVEQMKGAHSIELEKLNSEHTAELEEMHSTQQAVPQVPAVRNEDIEDLETKLKGVRELIGNKQDTIMLEEEVKSLREELQKNEDTESQTVASYKQKLEKMKCVQEEVVEEVNRLRRAVTEPCDDDSELLRRLKVDVRSLNGSLQSVMKEKTLLARDLEKVQRHSIEGEKKALELASRCRGLEICDEKMKEVSRVLPGDAHHGDKTELFEQAITQRDEALDDLRESFLKEVGRSSERYQALNSSRCELLTFAVRSDEADPDDVAKLKQTIISLGNELKTEKEEVEELHAGAMTLKEQLACKEKLLLSQQNGPSDAGSTKKLQEAYKRVSDLEMKLDAPVEGENGIVKQLKEELGIRSEAADALRAELGESRQKITEGETMVNKLREEYHAAQRADTSDKLMQELKRAYKDIEALKGDNVQLAKDVTVLTNEAKEVGDEEEKVREQHMNDLKRVQEATEELFSLRDELKKMSQQLAHNERTCVKWKKERDTALGSATKAHERLAEKDDIIKSLRAMYATQTKSLDKHKRSEVTAQKQTEALRVELKHMESTIGEKLQEEQVKWARSQSQKIEENNHQHDKLMIKKEEEFELLKKKLKKAHLSVHKVKERYDTKVLEAETLRGQLEDMKEDALKKLREAEKAENELDHNRDEISNIIRASKAARTRGLAEEDEEDLRVRRKSSASNMDKVTDKKRSIAAKRFDGSRGFTATEQASAAARNRVNGSFASFRRKSSRDLYDEGSPVPVPVPVPVPPMTPANNVDNDTPNHGINRDLSPKVQFNPRNRHREVEDRIRSFDEEASESPQPRGPSSLNKYSTLPSKNNEEELEEPPPQPPFNPFAASTSLSMGLGPPAYLHPSEEREEVPHTTVSLPGNGKRLG